MRSRLVLAHSDRCGCGAHGTGTARTSGSYCDNRDDGVIAVGAPLGTVLAALAIWRATMVTLSTLAVLVAMAVLMWIPPVQASDHETIGLRQRLSPIIDRRVLALLGTTLVAFTAIYVPYTYISVVAADATERRGLWLAALLSVLGVSGIVGNLLAGRLADRLGGRPVVASALLGLMIVFLLTPLWSTSLPTALLATAAYGLIGFGVSAPQDLSHPGPRRAAVALSGAQRWSPLPRHRAVRSDRRRSHHDPWSKLPRPTCRRRTDPRARPVRGRSSTPGANAALDARVTGSTLVHCCGIDLICLAGG
ncbi:MFS transporter [Saccharopolyspora taberi]|uniref:MFS transporter n=1 Tax=Saccharopolyspora taberi TaxID=60895 RepID=UPI003CD0BF80